MKQEKIFSGERSRDMWDDINKLCHDPDPDLENVGDLLYLIGCRLQELESRLEKVEKPVTTFEAEWKKMEAKGFQYGEDELELVRMGWEMHEEVRRKK